MNHWILSNTIISFPLLLVFHHSLSLSIIIWELFSSYQLTSEEISFWYDSSLYKTTSLSCHCSYTYLAIIFYDSRILTKPFDFFIPFHVDFEAADYLPVQLHGITIYSHETDFFQFATTFLWILLPKPSITWTCLMLLKSILHLFYNSNEIWTNSLK